jgi:cytochrome c biogenesis protein CcdA
LADSIDPTMIVPALYFAAGPDAARRVAGFAAGVFVVNTAGGVAIALGPGKFLLHLAPDPGPQLTRALELGTGVALLVAGIVLWHRRSDLPSPTGERLRRASPLVGATIALAEFPTAVPYFVVVVAVIRSHSSVAATIALLAGYQILYLAPVLALAALSARASHAEDGGRDDRVRLFLVRHENQFVAAILVAVAVVLLAAGSFGIATP